MNENKRTYVREGGAVSGVNPSPPYYLFYSHVKNFWTITSDDSFKKRDGKAFLKLKSEGLKYLVFLRFEFRIKKLKFCHWTLIGNQHPGVGQIGMMQLSRFLTMKANTTVAKNELK